MNANTHGQLSCDIGCTAPTDCFPDEKLREWVSETQDKLKAIEEEQAELKAEQAELRAGHKNLEAEQAELKARQSGFEVGPIHLCAHGLALALSHIHPQGVERTKGQPG